MIALVVLVSVAVVVAGFFVWLRWFRPFSIAELEAILKSCPVPGDLCTLEPGRTITVEGTVTRLRLTNTSLGPHTAVWLDQGNLPIMYRGDVRARFPEGHPVTLPLLIQTFRYNDIEFRGADGYPFPAAALTVGVLFAAVSRVAGIGLLPATVGPDSLTVRVASHRGEAFPLSLFRLSLVDVQGPLYIGESGYLTTTTRDEIEGWTPTGNGTSPLGWLSFTDVGGNGLLDIGDEITIRGHRTPSPLDFDSRMLLVNNMTGILFGVHYWYETSEGMMSYADATDLVQDPWITWGPESFTTGPPESVDRFQAVVVSGAGDPIQNWSYVIRDAVGQSLAAGSLAPGLFLSSAGLNGTIGDRDGDGALSVGDGLEIRGGVPRTRYSMEFALGGVLVGDLHWAVGYGEYTGAYPLAGFSNPTRLNTTALESDVRVTGGFPMEEARNFTLALFEGGSRVLSVDLSQGVSATASGITLTFLGGGDPLLLDPGDRVHLEGLRPGMAYTVEVLYHVPYPTHLAVSGSWSFTN